MSHKFFKWSITSQGMFWMPKKMCLKLSKFQYKQYKSQRLNWWRAEFIHSITLSICKQSPILKLLFYKERPFIMPNAAAPSTTEREFLYPLWSSNSNRTDSVLSVNNSTMIHRRIRVEISVFLGKNTRVAASYSAPIRNYSWCCSLVLSSPALPLHLVFSFSTLPCRNSVNIFGY